MKSFFSQRILPVFVLGLCIIAYHPVVSAEVSACLCKKATALSGDMINCDDKIPRRLAGIAAHIVDDNKIGEKAKDKLSQKVEGNDVCCTLVKQQVGKPSLQTYFCTVDTGNGIKRDLAAEMVMEGLVVPTGGEGRADYVALGKDAERRRVGIYLKDFWEKITSVQPLFVVAVVGLITIFFNLLLHCTQRKNEVIAIEVALKKEMDSLFKRIEPFKKQLETVENKLGSGQAVELPQFLFQDDGAIIYKNNASKIGMLKKMKVKGAVQFYSSLENANNLLRELFDGDNAHKIDVQKRFRIIQGILKQFKTMGGGYGSYNDGKAATTRTCWSWFIVGIVILIIIICIITYFS